MTLHNLAVICLSSTLLVFPGCSTEDIPGHLLIASEQPGSDRGGVAVDIAPPDGAGLTDVNPKQEYLFIDGQVVAAPHAAWIYTTSPHGPPLAARYLPAGPHHFAIAAPGQTRIFETDGQLPGEGTLHLLLYGPLDRLQAVAVSIPDVPSAGNEHITVVNLLKSGQIIEVVRCVDSTTSCTPVSPPLALGDVLDAEFPAVFDDCDPVSSPPGGWGGGCFTTMTNERAGIGYRLVPTASNPNPPISALTVGFSNQDSRSRFIAAPVYMTDDGHPQYVID